MQINNIIGIVADDLTGANDTALQFYLHDASTHILLNLDVMPETLKNIDIWATSTESRNIDSASAYENARNACRVLKEKFGVEHFYKKIDSTLRGNIAPEVLAVLEETGKDIAIIAPAFIQEGRVTVGGYQLVKGIPIERTEAARDPQAPIYESNIVNILKKQLPLEEQNCVGLIEHCVVSKGAASITLKINEMARDGKKLLVCDALSVVDIEQIVLAMKKCSYDVLPVGSAGLAQALAEDWTEKIKKNKLSKKIPKLPKLILSGSATELSALQIKKFQEDEDFDNTYVLNLKLSDILDGLTSLTISRIVQNLVKDNIVVVHVSDLNKELEDDNSSERDRLIDEGITRDDLARMITDYLAELLYEVKSEREFVLITIGGETSFKCAKKINAEHLTVLDAILPAIPICMDINGQFLVTKSGNLGTSSTLIEIMKYFKDHE